MSEAEPTELPGWTKEKADKLLEVLVTFRTGISEIYDIPNHDGALLVGAGICLKLFLEVYGPRLPLSRRRALKKMAEYLANPE